MKYIINLILITIFWYLVFSYLFLSFNPSDFIAYNFGRQSIDCKLFQVLITLVSYVVYLVNVTLNNEK